MQVLLWKDANLMVKRIRKEVKQSSATLGRPIRFLLVDENETSTHQST